MKIRKIKKWKNKFKRLAKLEMRKGKDRVKTKFFIKLYALMVCKKMDLDIKG